MEKYRLFIDTTCGKATDSPDHFLQPIYAKYDGIIYRPDRKQMMAVYAPIDGNVLCDECGILIDYLYTLYQYDDTEETIQQKVKYGLFDIWGFIVKLKRWWIDGKSLEEQQEKLRID